MAKKAATKPAAKKVGPTDLIAKAQAALKECMKQEKGQCQKGYEFYGDGKAATQVRKLIQKKELAPFWAKHFRVTQERFEQWRDYQGSDKYPSPHQCSAITKSGRQCTRMAEPAFTPKIFYKGKTDCCDQHQRRLSRDEYVEYQRLYYGTSKAEAEFIADNPGEALKQLTASIRQSLGR